MIGRHLVRVLREEPRGRHGLRRAQRRAQQRLAGVPRCSRAAQQRRRDHNAHFPRAHTFSPARAP